MTKWRCTVCGYVHEGLEPPDQCPVCGADRSRFVNEEAVKDVAASVDTAEQKTGPSNSRRWQCTVCGSLHEGATPPDACPVCGSEGRHFTDLDKPRNPLASTPEDNEAGSLGGDQRWQCSVCGYIHTGSEPPSNCPVCGTAKSQFVAIAEPAEEAPPPSSATEEIVTSEYAPHAEGSSTASLFMPYRRWIDMAIEYHAHPIAVHIPNGVLPITVAMVFLAAIFDWPAIGHAGVYNMGFILLSMPVVLFSGYLHWQFKFGGNMTGLFKWKIICGASVMVMAFILFSWGLIAPDSARHPGAVYLLLHFIMLSIAGVAGWLGGKLVFRPKA